MHETDAAASPVTTNRCRSSTTTTPGDLDARSEGGRRSSSRAYSVPMIQQTCMGTAGCIAEFDLRGNLTIWAKTQIPFLAQRDFNRALGDGARRNGNSRVIVPALGGGFGTGLDTHCYEYIAILLAHRTGRPVKILYDREEEFAYLSPRQSAHVRVVQGCDSAGRLLFREVEVLQDNGAYAPGARPTRRSCCCRRPRSTKVPVVTSTRRSSTPTTPTARPCAATATPR